MYGLIVCFISIWSVLLYVVHSLARQNKQHVVFVIRF